MCSPTRPSPTVGTAPHASACSRTCRRAGSPGVASSLVLLELANALRKFGRPKIAGEAVASARALLAGLFEMDAELAEDGVRAAAGAKQDPYDGPHVATLRKHGLASVISTDADFEEFPGIRRIDPLAYVAERDSGPRAKRP